MIPFDTKAQLDEYAAHHVPARRMTPTTPTCGGSWSTFSSSCRWRAGKPSDSPALDWPRRGGEIVQFPTDEVEFGRCWSSTVGHLSGTQNAPVLAEQRAANAYIRGQDLVAAAIRALARELQQLADKLKAELEGYVQEDGRRRNEMARVVKNATRST